MKYLFFDTETTGLLENSLVPIERQQHIIELFMLLCDENGTEIETFGCYFKPPVLLSPEVQLITGLRDEDFEEQPTFAEKSVQIAMFMRQADCVVAHNLSFDRRILEYEFKRAGGGIEFGSTICTVEATEHLEGFRLSLAALHDELFGFGFHGAHGAEADTRATAKCFFELKKRGEI